ncbi:hypothetical protein D3C80_1944070 [compost metagenome]
MEDAAADQQAALPRLGAVLTEGVAVEAGADERLIGGGAGDIQSGLGQPIARQEGQRVKAAGAEAVGEGQQAVLADRLGA